MQVIVELFCIVVLGHPAISIKPLACAVLNQSKHSIGLSYCSVGIQHCTPSCSLQTSLLSSSPPWPLDLSAVTLALWTGNGCTRLAMRCSNILQDQCCSGGRPFNVALSGDFTQAGRDLYGYEPPQFLFDAAQGSVVRLCPVRIVSEATGTKAQDPR